MAPLVLGSYPPGHTSVPASKEIYGHLGKPIMQYIRALSDVASARSLAVTQRLFLASAHQFWAWLLQRRRVNCTVLLLAKAALRRMSPGADMLFLD
jgi:hypothetical protein